MQRSPEPELMNGSAQAQAYAEADFSCGDAHTQELIERLIGTTAPLPRSGRLLDLGCGPGNITLRLASRFPDATVIGIDGAEEMLKLARQQAERLNLAIDFQCCDLRQVDLPPVDLITSNSLLHHLHQPELLWTVTRSVANPGCRVLHRDLRRPGSRAEIQALQQRHLPDAPAVLVEDFCASLAAAFEPDEVRDQLKQAGLDGLTVQEEDDRYLVVSGLVD